jgi:hypothetical protein
MSQSSNGSWTLNLSAELLSRVKELQREGQTPNDVMEQVFKLGLYQLEYRREANPKKAEQNKLMRKVFKQAQSDPELAVKLGLGTRVAL